MSCVEQTAVLSPATVKRTRNTQTVSEMSLAIRHNDTNIDECKTHSIDGCLCPGGNRTFFTWFSPPWNDCAIHLNHTVLHALSNPYEHYLCMFIFFLLQLMCMQSSKDAATQVYYCYYYYYYAPPLIGGALSDAFVWRLSVWPQTVSDYYYYYALPLIGGA